MCSGPLKRLPSLQCLSESCDCGLLSNDQSFDDQKMLLLLESQKESSMNRSC